MKTRKNFVKSEASKLLLVVPMILLALILFSLNASGQKAETQKKEIPSGMTEGAFQKVDVMPVFPGGDAALLKFIADSTHYPKDAKEHAIQGKVITRFMVKEDGSVSDVSVLKGVSPSLDNESIRVVKMLPKFSPGILNGKSVPVWYIVPITFKLK